LPDPPLLGYESVLYSLVWSICLLLPDGDLRYSFHSYGKESMKSDKIRKFMQLAGQSRSAALRMGTEAERKLGAQLLLSEVLEYVILGLGVTPEIQGVQIKNPDAVTYSASQNAVPLEMVDGLADVAYTMYWNAEAFGLPLEQAFETVCDNNLEKFVRMKAWKGAAQTLVRSEWHCGQDIVWPNEVVQVQIVQVGEEYYAVGKDQRGKVRKPSSYKPVDLHALIE
jgi:hypothetical protein